jgi:hypothetical protein
MKKNISQQKSDEKVVSQVSVENTLTGVQLLKKRAERGSREKFLQALSKAPKVEPVDDDRID